jgi:heme iron utilization protein
MLADASKGYLATRRAADGHPYASLVLVATDTKGQPLFLISRLALHTQNLLADPAASLLVDATDGEGDPMSGGRVTFIGSIHAIDDAEARARFLARHPGAESYAAFADFGLYAMTIESAHLIHGFGRIVSIAGPALAAACAGMPQR